MTAPAPGSMSWVRAWYGPTAKRGAHVRVDGRNARVLSARDGLVYLRMWTSGERIGVKPTDLVSA